MTDHSSLVCEFTWTPDDGVVHIRPHACELFGTDGQPVTLTEEKWFSTVHENDRTRVRNALKLAVDEGRPVHLRYRMDHEDSSVRWAEIVARREQADGMVLHGFILDRTAEVERESQVTMLQTASEQAPVGIVLTDPDGVILYTNPAFKRLTGLSDDDARGQTPRVLKTGHTSSAEYEELWHTITNGGVWAGRFKNRGPNDTTWWAQVRIAPVTDPVSGETIGFSGVQLDVTREVEAEQALLEERASLAERIAERTKELNEANVLLAKGARMKDEFLAAMSHELRTPLNTILTLGESLEEGVYGGLEEEQLKPLRTVTESGRHLLGLINDILDLSKIGAGKLDVAPSPSVVADVCETSLRFVRTTAMKKGLDLQVDVEPDLPVLMIDALRLKQVLVNLLGNAVKFTPDGGQVGLKVHRDRQDQLLWMDVWDTGIGIASEDLQRVFQPFAQVDSRLSRRFEGTGLGLALVSQLVDLLGGGVFVASPGEGQGSTFTVCLPFIEVDYGQASESMIERQPAAASTAPSNGQDQGVRGSLLIVDDNLRALSAFGDYFSAKGFTVRTATGGAEAVELVAEDPPQVILMDVQMPGMDGMEATRRIRETMSADELPIVAVTALAMPGDRQLCLDAGMSEYVTKPVRLSELEATVSDLLRQDDHASDS